MIVGPKLESFASVLNIPLFFWSSANPCRKRSDSDGGRRLSGPRGPDTCSCKVRRSENASIHAHTRAQCLAHTHLKQGRGWPALGYYSRRPGGERQGAAVGWVASYLHKIVPHRKLPSLFITVPPRFPCSWSRVFPTNRVLETGGALLCYSFVEKDVP